MLHSAFLLVFMLAAAPLASYIPLAALAGVLAVVAWNMAEKHTFAAFLRGNRAEAAVLLITFLLTVFRDLTEGILSGVLLGAVLFAVRMARLAEVSMRMDLIEEDGENGDSPLEARDLMVFRLEGPLFFGTAPDLQDVLGRVGAKPKIVIFDFRSVPFIDATGVAALERHVAHSEKSGARVLFSGVTPLVARELDHFGLPETRVVRASSVRKAYERALSDADGVSPAAA